MAEGASAEDKNYAMILHLTGLSVFIGIPGFVGPLVMWLIKKEDSPYIDQQGKEALNFHLSMLIWIVISAILIIILIGIVGIIVFALLEVIFSVLAALKAANGEDYHYPLAIRFLK